MNAKISGFVICANKLKRSYICYYLICITVRLILKQMFKYLQRIPFVKEACCLRKTLHKKLANKESGWVQNETPPAGFLRYT